MNRTQKLASKALQQQTSFHTVSVFLGFAVFYVLFFSSILFSDQLFAAGDTLVYYLPAFFAKRTLWTPNLFSGFPAAADPQIQTWYPLSALFSLFHAWNAYTVIAFVLASCFVYGYVHHLTRSKLASTLSGIIYGLSGFMISHIDHTTMIHAAAWIPLFVWALDRLRIQFEKRWFAAGTIAIALCILSGHPQISTYGVGIAVLYSAVFGWNAPIGRWRYYRIAAGMIGFGVLMTAIQVIPTIEFSRLSVRAEMTFENFVSFSLPLWQAPMLLFPFFTFSKLNPSVALNSDSAWLHGTETAAFYGISWGEWGWADTTGYVGLLPILLAIAAFRTPYRLHLWFWTVCGVFALLLAFGDGTPVASMVYHWVPIYNKFRAQGRSFIHVHLAISILAGLGAAAIEQQRVTPKTMRQSVLALGFVMLVIVIGLNVFLQPLKAKSAHLGVTELSFLPWENSAIAVPLLILVTSGAALLYWSQRQSRLSVLVLLAVLLLDLGSFGQFGYRMYNRSDTSILAQTQAVQKYRSLLHPNHQRLLSMLDYDPNPPEFAPNLSRLWDLPNANGYSPMTLSRLSNFYPMSGVGGVPDGRNNSGRSLDLAAIRYLLMPAPIVRSWSGMTWAWYELGFQINATQRSLTLNLPKSGHTTNTIGLVTLMANSIDIPNLADVVKITATDFNGKSQVLTLKAGRDTAEWSVNCAAVKSQHQAATVFATKPTADKACNAQNYVSLIALPSPAVLKTLTLTWLQPRGELHFNKISLIDTQLNRSFLVSPDARSLSHSPKWRQIEMLGDSIVYENQQAMPRTWLVPEVMRLNSETIQQVIQTGKLPDGRLYDPAQVALVERSLAVKSPALDGTATLTQLEDTEVVVETDANAPAFLVLSDVYYPGWRVTVDGKPQRLYRANYLFRGVPVTAGRHQVKFQFAPLSFHIGAGISAAAIAALIFILCRKPPRYETT